jgi:hypothetical protein
MMMRLIDADNLKPDAQWEFFYNCYFAYSISQIDDAPTVKAVPIEKIQTLINDIEVMRTSPALIDNDDVQKFAENVLYALNRLIKESGEEQANANQHNSNALNALEGDAISRQAVLDVINLNWEYRRNCIRAIEKLPPVKQEPSSSENDLLQRLRKRISDLYNTDVTYDNGDYNTMDTPTLDKVLEYFDSEVNT